MDSSCEVCGLVGNGYHFGVFSCRACAAFFRRTDDSRWSKMQCLSIHCTDKAYHCKPCRLKRCRAVGMDMSKIQQSRNSAPVSAPSSIELSEIPQSLDYFIGRPSAVLFCLQDSTEPQSKNTFIDLNNLVSRAIIIMRLGPEAPLLGRSQLEKFSFACNSLRKIEKPTRIEFISQEVASSFWEYHLLATARWLSHFEKFENLKDDLKLKILFAVWHVWGRLDKIMCTAIYRARNEDAKPSERLLGNGILSDMQSCKGDPKWFSRFSHEQLAYFLNGIRAVDLFPLIDELQALRITDIEFTFLSAQLCFQYAASRFTGKIAELMEEFQLILSNDLHTYYVEEKNMPRYSSRLLKMLNINRQILEDIRKHRTRADIARAFNVFRIEFSHIDMFRDTGYV